MCADPCTTSNLQTVPKALISGKSKDILEKTFSMPAHLLGDLLVHLAGEDIRGNGLVVSTDLLNIVHPVVQLKIKVPSSFVIM